LLHYNNCSTVESLTEQGRRLQDRFWPTRATPMEDFTLSRRVRAPKVERTGTSSPRMDPAKAAQPPGLRSSGRRSVGVSVARLGERPHYGRTGARRGAILLTWLSATCWEESSNRAGSTRDRFYRDGCCNTGPRMPAATRSAPVVTAEFLEHQRRIGNDLTTPMPAYRFPGLTPGDRWCVTAANWLQAHYDGAASYVTLAATHERALEIVPLAVLQEHAVDVPSDPSSLGG